MSIENSLPIDEAPEELRESLRMLRHRVYYADGRHLAWHVLYDMTKEERAAIIRWRIDAGDPQMWRAGTTEEQMKRLARRLVESAEEVQS